MTPPSAWRVISGAATTLVAAERRTRRAGAMPVGVTTRTLGGVRAILWYPAARGTRERVVRYGRAYIGRGAWEAPPAAGAAPQVALLSHGFTATAYELTWLAERLAASGMLAVAEAHDDAPDALSAAGMRRRAGHLRAALDALGELARETELARGADLSRVLVGGHSLGGATALVFAGALPRGGAAASDARVRAVVVTAPGPIDAFDDAGLACLRAPVLVASGTADDETPLATNAARVAAAVPEARLLTIEGAGHYLFKPPGTAWAILRSPGLCLDAPGIDRRAWHDRIAAEARAWPPHDRATA